MENSFTLYVGTKHKKKKEKLKIFDDVKRNLWDSDDFNDRDKIWRSCGWKAAEIIKNQSGIQDTRDIKYFVYDLYGAMLARIKESKHKWENLKTGTPRFAVNETQMKLILEL